MSFIQPRSTQPHLSFPKIVSCLALTCLATACAWNRLVAPSLAVTAVPRLTGVSAEPAPPPDSTDWVTVTPLYLDAGQLNLEIANRTGEEITVRWGDVELVGLDGRRGGLEVANLKLDARGALSVPSRLTPYAVVQVRMTPDRAPRFPDSVEDSTEAQRLCEDIAAREMQLTLPVERGRERRVYTVHLLNDVRVSMTDASRVHSFGCSRSSLVPGI